MTLRHRHTARWHELMVHLRTLPDFTSAWIAAHDAEEDFASRLRVHQYEHTQVGALRYAVLVTTSVALANNLHLTTLLALDAQTFEVFTSLHVESRGNFSRWPFVVEPNN